MSNQNAKLARQQQAINITKTTIAKLETYAKNAKTDTDRINANLVLAQLRTKLQRQLTAVKLTQFHLDLNID